MGEASEEARRRAMESLSLEIEKYPRDLLQRFTCMSSNTQKQKSNEEEEEEDSEEIELNLGLSLGGRFGVDKSKKKLIRSSSIDMSYRNTIDVSYRTNTTVLTRTSSLPTETEEEWRKRKELQTLRRMAAKRRRSEKQRSCKVEREEERKEIESPMGLNLRDRQQSLSLPVAMANRLNSTLSLPFRMPSWESNKRLQAQGILILTFVCLFCCCCFFFWFPFLKYILSGKRNSNPVGKH